jgi:serine protease Do
MKETEMQDMEEVTSTPQDDQMISKKTLTKYLLFFSIGGVCVAIILSVAVSIIALVVLGHVPSPLQKIINQPVKTVSQESAVINAVQKENPAVVSIIISEDVASVPQQINPLDPFGFLNGNNGNSNGNGSTNGSTQQEVGGGSGMIVSSDGLILTNKHVASDTNATYTVVLTTGKQYTGKIVAQDPTNDIALLKIDASGLPTVNLGDSSNLVLGQSVVAIGNALGQYANTVSVGVVSGLNRVVTASDASSNSSETLHNIIQTDAQINPGNSGGPLLNVDGQVVGMNTAIAQNAQGIGFAIPIDQAKTDISAYNAKGKITKPELGVSYEIIDSQYLASNPKTPYSYGAIITTGGSSGSAVISGSPADKAGLQSGDIILEVNGTQVDDTNTLTDLIQQHNVGDTITLQVYESGSVKNVSVTLSQSFSG